VLLILCVLTLGLLGFGVAVSFLVGRNDGVAGGTTPRHPAREAGASFITNLFSAPMAEYALCHSLETEGECVPADSRCSS
jgi:hypothetical protein